MKDARKIGVTLVVLLLSLTLVLPLRSWPAAATHGQDDGTPVPLGEMAPPPVRVYSGPGPDIANTRALTDRERQHKRRTRHLADRWADILQWDTLDAAELAKLDGVVRSQAYWIAFEDGAGDLPSVARDQTMPVIIELDAAPDMEVIATLSPHVARLRHSFRVVDAMAVDLSPAQLADVARLPHVRYVWPDAVVQTHLDRSVEQIGAHAIHAAGLTGDGVKVAVVDRGIQDDHPVLDGRVVAERYDQDDGNHATHVAGIVAASGDLTGVAPDALLLDAVFDQDDDLEGAALWSDVIAAMEWAVDQGADVINASVGAPLWQYPQDGTSIVDAAVNNIVTQDGVPVVVSVGNTAQKHDTGAAEAPDPGQTNQYWHGLTVNGDGEGLRVTLWWDTYNNDLDLALLAPDDAQYNSQGAPGDTVGTNPVIVYEQVSIPPAEIQTGDWWVVVQAADGDVPVSPQDYRLSIDIGDAAFTSPDPEGTVNVPATAEHALAVGSVKDGTPDSDPPATPVNERSDFSSQGPAGQDPFNPSSDPRIKPQVMAPGEAIQSAWAGSFYMNDSGTSQAAPHVAGVAALLLEAAGKGAGGEWQLTPAEIRGAIVDTALDLDGDAQADNVLGTGLVYPGNAIFTGTVTHHASRYFKVTPRYTSDTYPGVTGRLVSYDWETVACRWDAGANDLDLYLYRLDTGAEVDSAATTNPTYDKIDGQDAIPDDRDYVLRVYGWYVDGSASFTGVSTNDVRPVDPPSLSVAADVANPDEADLDQTFTIRFDVRNDGDLPARDVAVALDLPPGVERVSGSNPQPVGTLAPGDQVSATWTVRGTVEGAKTFTAGATSHCWGDWWGDEGSDSVTIRPPDVSLAYDDHTLDDDDRGESDGDGDGVVECGETIEMHVTLANGGGDTATDVNATLGESDAHVDLLYNADSSYPDIPGGGTGVNDNDFDFAVDPGTPDGHVVHFDLDVTAASGGPWSEGFDVTVVCNQPPNEPGNPTPPDLATGQDVSVDLGWTGGDPDPGDSVTYDVYFEADDPTPDDLLCNDVPAPACDPGPLAFETDYYWYVVATDARGATRTGAVWQFTTENTPLVGPLVVHGLTVDDDASGESNGNGDGVVNCGETVELYATLRNQGSSTATGVNAAISESDAYATLTGNVSSSYPDVAGGGTGANSDDFEITVAADAPDGHVIPFDLDVTASNGGPWADAFDLPVVCVLPDLTVTDIDASPALPSAGEVVTFTVDVENWGDVSTADWGSFDVTCYMDGGSSPFDSATVASVGAHGATSVACRWTATEGTHTITATVDPADAVPESNEGNNDRSESLVVGLDCYDPQEPNDTWDQATPIAYGEMAGTIDVCPAGDSDYYAFTGQMGDDIIADVQAEPIGSYLDATLILYDTDGTTPLAQSTDHDGLDPLITHTLLADGTYYLAVREANHGVEGGINYFYNLSLDLGVDYVGPVLYADHVVDDDNTGNSSGDGNTIVDCGETIELAVALRNQGSDDALGVTGYISASSPYVTWLDTIAAYADIAAGETVSSTDRYDFAVDAATPDRHVLEFDLYLTADNGGPWADTFTATVRCNEPPIPPGDPAPADGAIDQPLDAGLSWTGGDPDPGDTVTYDVYFEGQDPTPDEPICEDISATTCDPGPLGYGNRYYWQVVARDNHGETATGLVWDFSTLQLPVGPVEYVSHRIIDDGSGYSSGNGDGKVGCGETIEVYVTLTNRGVYSATGVTVDVWPGDIYAAPIYYSSPYPDILGGESEENEAYAPLVYGIRSDTPDEHVLQFTLSIDASNGGPWTDTFDIPVTCPQPDLAATAIDLVPPEPLDGDPVQFAVTVANQGDISTTKGMSFTVDCYLDGGGTPFDNNVIAPGLGAGTTISATCDWTAVEGTHAITAVVDSGGVISEVLESNNDLRRTFLIRGSCADPREPNDVPGQATTVAYGATLDDAEVCPAGDVDVYAFTGQAGDYVIAEIDALSGSALSPTLVLSDTDGVIQLDRGHSIITHTLPAGGTYYLTAKAADHPGAGGPNYLYTLALAGGAGPLAYEALTVDDDADGWSSGDADGVVDCGETVELDVSLANQGTYTITGVVATLDTADPEIALLYGSERDYADIAGGEASAGSKPFAIQIPAGLTDGHRIPFGLATEAANGLPVSDGFTLTVTCATLWNEIYLPLVLREAN